MCTARVLCVCRFSVMHQVFSTPPSCASLSVLQTREGIWQQPGWFYQKRGGDAFVLWGVSCPCYKELLNRGSAHVLFSGQDFLQRLRRLWLTGSKCLISLRLCPSVSGDKKLAAVQDTFGKQWLMLHLSNAIQKIPSSLRPFLAFSPFLALYEYVCEWGEGKRLGNSPKPTFINSHQLNRADNSLIISLTRTFVKCRVSATLIMQQLPCVRAAACPPPPPLTCPHFTR